MTPEEIENPTPSLKLLWDEMFLEEKQEWHQMHTYQFPMYEEARWDEQEELSAMTPDEKEWWESLDENNRECIRAMAEYDTAKMIHHDKISDLRWKVRKRIEEKTGKKYCLYLRCEGDNLWEEEVLEEIDRQSRLKTKYGLLNEVDYEMIDSYKNKLYWPIVSSFEQGIRKLGLFYFSSEYQDDITYYIRNNTSDRSVTIDVSYIILECTTIDMAQPPLRFDYALLDEEYANKKISTVVEAHLKVVREQKLKAGCVYVPWSRIGYG